MHMYKKFNICGNSSVCTVYVWHASIYTFSHRHITQTYRWSTYNLCIIDLYVIREILLKYLPYLDFTLEFPGLTVGTGTYPSVHFCLSFYPTRGKHIFTQDPGKIYARVIQFKQSSITYWTKPTISIIQGNITNTASICPSS